ncbi:MAG: hypothetical protein ABSG53_10040, partial [Thermoguttaceae bacterium]
MNKYRWAIGGTMALMCLGLVPRSPAADEKTPAADQSTFKMAEISLFDQTQDVGGDSVQMLFRGGVTAALTANPAKEVKAYPKLNSKRPLYGTVVLNQDPEKPGKWLNYYFVFDQSPKAIEAAAKPEEKESGDESDKNVKKPAVQKTLAGQYDLLYFDANHDMDLTNDAVVHLMKEPPKAVAQWLGNAENTRIFDAVAVSLGEGPSLRMLPMLWNAGDRGVVYFMATSAWQGEIRLGKKAYKATLSQPTGMLGRFDRPSSPLILTPVDGPKQPQSYLRMSTLGTIRDADGEFYTISASPTGDRLFVHPYSGECGVLELSAGKRDIKEMGLAGILQFKGAIFPLGEMSFPIPVERARVPKYRLPVGDYQLAILYADYGDLKVTLRANYNRGVRTGKTPGTIEIRKDKPYTLDFSEKAEMQFIAPPENKVFKPGDTISLAAMLAIP